MIEIDATAKSPKNAAKTTATLQNQVGKVLLTLASLLFKIWLFVLNIVENRSKTVDFGEKIFAAIRQNAKF